MSRPQPGYRPPRPLLPAALWHPPITEEPDLRFQQLPWEVRDVTIPAITPHLSSPSSPYPASPEST